MQNELSITLGFPYGRHGYLESHTMLSTELQTDDQSSQRSQIFGTGYTKRQCQHRVNDAMTLATQLSLKSAEKSLAQLHSFQ